MRLPSLLGLALAGYGVLVLLEVIAHDARLAGAASLGAGVLLLLLYPPHATRSVAPTQAGVPAQAGAPAAAWHRPLVATLGAVCTVGVLGYNAARASDLSLPECGILAYGVALLAASGHLQRTIGPMPVSKAVAWSFPLLLAPLGMFALNAAISAGSGATAAAPVVEATVVVPTAILLAMLGTPVELVGDNMVLATERGSLVLGVGLVCAGLYPMILFAGMAGLQAWQEQVPRRRMALFVGAGLAGLWLLNLVRLVVLTKVGQRWGAEALQTTHAHIGWILFAVFMLAYWSITRERTSQGVPESP